MFLGLLQGKETVLVEITSTTFQLQDCSFFSQDQVFFLPIPSPVLVICSINNKNILQVNSVSYV